MRQLYVDLAQNVSNDAADKALEVCAILAKADWTLADRTTLLNVIESLYEHY